LKIFSKYFELDLEIKKNFVTQLKNNMKVENHLFYAAFIYTNGADKTKNNFELGDIVLREDEDGVEIGVIIQIHDDVEFRTDMFGNTNIDDCRLATIEEIKKYRPDVYELPFTVEFKRLNECKILPLIQTFDSRGNKKQRVTIDGSIWTKTKTSKY
jgi:hypothetical protein